MIRYTLITVSILFVGSISIYGQSLTTSTDYPSTSSPGTVLTSFDFEMYYNYVYGDVDNVFVGDANGNVHVSVSGTWNLVDLLSGNDNPITSLTSGLWPEENFVGTSSGIHTSFTGYSQDRNDVPDDERRSEAMNYQTEMINANIKELEDGTEGIWAATMNNGLYNYGEEEAATHFVMSNSPLTTNNIASLGLTSTNHVVIAHGSSISLFRYKQGNTLPWENHDLATSFCDGIQTQYVFVGDSDEIYVTTNMGVFNYDGAKFNKVPEFGNRDYSQIISTPSGEVWAFEENVGFHILKGGAVGFIPTDNVDVPGQIYDIKYDKGTVKFLSDLNHGITSASYVSGNSDADGDGVSYTLDGDDSDNSILASAVEICDDGIDNDCDGEVDEECPVDPVDPSLLVIGQPHPTLGGYIFYLNGLGGGLIVDEEDLLNPDFDNLSMFRWAEPDHLRTETGLEYIDFGDWSVTSEHTDELLIDAYGADGNFAALVIQQELGAEWRLPTATEAYYIDLNLNQADLGNFADGYYWTSSEVPFPEADIAPPYVVAIDMTNGEISENMAKIQALKVRAVRSF